MTDAPTDTEPDPATNQIPPGIGPHYKTYADTGYPQTGSFVDDLTHIRSIDLHYRDDHAVILDTGELRHFEINLARLYGLGYFHAESIDHDTIRVFFGDKDGWDTFHTPGDHLRLTHETDGDRT